MNLWQEMFSVPSPILFTPQEWNESWNWIFQDKETATLKLTIIRKHSLTLKLAGHARTAEMASVALYRKSRIKMPIKRLPE